MPSSWFVGLNDVVAAKVKVNALEMLECGIDESECELDRGFNAEAYILAGPREEIAFEPKACKAAIVTCGGLCPGLNTVIREVVMCLRRQYGVNETYGVPAGYRGFLDAKSWVYWMKGWLASCMAKVVLCWVRHAVDMIL